MRPRQDHSRPMSSRIKHISEQLQQHLRTQRMTPEQARKLAGKCSFTTTQLFGRVGRAALRALYDKAFSNTDTINSHTHSAITAFFNTASQDNFPYSHNKHNTPSSSQTHSTKKVTNYSDAQIYMTNNMSSHLLPR